MRKLILVIITLFLLTHPSLSQDFTSVLKGTVTDSETKIILTGAYIQEMNDSSGNIAVTDNRGKFRLAARIGRVTIKVTYIGYEDLVIRDILVGSGKEADIGYLRGCFITTS